jgi:hypothetical protein
MQIVPNVFINGWFSRSHMKQAALVHVMQNDADDESRSNIPHTEGRSQQEHNCLEMHRPRIEIYADLCRRYQA